MRIIYPFLTLLTALIFTLCTQEGSQEKPVYLFTKMDHKSTGFNFENRLIENQNFNLFTWKYIYNGAGIGVGDFNKDGLPDLYMVSNVGPCKLFQNAGDWQFEDVTRKAGVQASQGYKTGVTVVDINGDGWLDIYLCRDANPNPALRRNLVFINNRDMTFKESGRALGLVDSSYSTQALFFDMDQDNDLDLYLINHPKDFSESVYIKPDRLKDQRNKSDMVSNLLFENQGGTFKDISTNSHTRFSGFGLGGITHDFNEDGLQDIFVANDFIEPDLLYINNGNKTFAESAQSFFPHMSQNSMGIDLADINGDGRLDLVVTDMLAENNERQKVFDTNMKLDRYERLRDYGYGKQMMRNSLFIANNDLTFSEIGCFAGIEKSDWSWSAIFNDLNLDGETDLFITNGIARDMSDKDFIEFQSDSVQKARRTGIEAVTAQSIMEWIKLIPSTPQANHVYINQGGRFTNQATQLGLNDLTFSQGAATVDLDNDGDLDIVLSNQGAKASLYQNQVVQSENKSFIKIALNGPEKNPSGLGAQVSLFQGELVQSQLVSSNKGFLSSNRSPIVFGINDSIPVKIEVDWPDGTSQSFDALEPNRTHLLSYKGKKVPKLPLKPQMASKDLLRPAFEHRENNFNDFKREPLLLRPQSRKGPALAIADINDDGRSDLYIGGAFNQQGMVYVQTSTGYFNSINEPFAADSRYEDTDAVFFDIENDGDLDLYLVSGGAQFNGKNGQYNDRVFLNDGNGNMSFLKEIPTRSSASDVEVIDFNKDGFMDLFVGSGHTPGKIPASPYSFLIRNDLGQLTIADSILLGNVTECRSVDLNQDGFSDLIAVGEWLPVSILINDQEGGFDDRTAEYGLDDTEGWWQCLELADIDGDGTLEILTGNVGLNTLFDLNTTEPITIYRDDFDGNESAESVVTHYLNGTEWPFARKEVLTGILPQLKKKFLSNKAYGSASVVDLLGEEKINNASKFYAREFRSGYFKMVSGIYQFFPFPNKAQYSQINDLVVDDINHDGYTDVLFAGNMEFNEVEQGPLDAGKGGIIYGRPSGLSESVVDLNLAGVVSKLRLIEIKDQLHLLAAKNNEPLQIQKFND